MVWKQQAERASAQSTGPPEAPQKQFGSSNKKVRQILEAGDTSEMPKVGEDRDLRQRIMQARTAKGLTQAKLAQAMSLSQAEISSFEAGKAMPSGATLSKMSRVLGVVLSAKKKGKGAKPASRAA